jgi:hypothetical protein
LSQLLTTVRIARTVVNVKYKGFYEKKNVCFSSSHFPIFPKSSLYSPDFIWLACGGSEGLNPDKCKCLKGRNVMLCPDAGMFDKWNEKAEQLRTVCESVYDADMSLKIMIITRIITRII